MPSPHIVSMHVFVVHASVLTEFPSSHCSTPVLTMLSPQVAVLHVFKQASVLITFPSSHCSPDSVTEFPHTPVVVPVHMLLHLLGCPFNAPSSHVSGPFTTPSPHLNVVVHVLNPVHNTLHDCAPTYPLIVQDCELESHCSTPVIIIVSPQVAVLHVFKQASVLITFPSSHCSPLSATVFPQTGAVVPVQTLLHILGCPFNAPASHVSFPFNMPSPQLSPVVHATNPLHAALHNCTPEYPLIVQACKLRSHISPTDGCITLSPQIGVVHAFVHKSESIVLPSSHCSPVSVILFLHVELEARVTNIPLVLPKLVILTLLSSLNIALK